MNKLKAGANNTDGESLSAWRKNSVPNPLFPPQYEIAWAGTETRSQQ